MHQLSMTDAFMLAVENRRQTLQMASLSVLAQQADGELPLTRKQLRDLVAERIHLAPALHRRLAHVPLGLDYPYWVEDSEWDVDYHVRDCALPAPGDDRQLAEKVAQIVSQPLDHSRPLWELYLVEGLEGGRKALLFKLHHAAVDGISGLELHTMLFDSTPAGRTLPPSVALPLQAAPSRRTLIGHGIASLARQPARALRGARQSLPYLDQIMPFRVVPGVPAISRAARRMANWLGKEGDGALIEGENLQAPRTVLDRPITPHRKYAFVRLSLDAAKHVKQRFGVTINDVVVATLAGAVREWLLQIDELPSEPLVALVPISVRTEESGTGGNRVQVMLIPLPTDEVDAERRLLRTSEALRSAKERHKAVPASAIAGAEDLIMPALFIRASRAATLLGSLGRVTANMVVSNVPGPAEPVYVAGRRVEALYPVGGLVEGFGFTTIVFSYCRSLSLGFVVDSECVADPWRLAQACERSMHELEQLSPTGASKAAAHHARRKGDASGGAS